LVDCDVGERRRGRGGHSGDCQLSGGGWQWKTGISEIPGLVTFTHPRIVCGIMNPNMIQVQLEDQIIRCDRERTKKAYLTIVEGAAKAMWLPHLQEL